MGKRGSFRALLVATFLLLNVLVSRGATADEEDHHMDEEAHEEVTINSVSYIYITAQRQPTLPSPSLCRLGLYY